MKIFTPGQIKTAEQCTLKEESISSFSLVERAGKIASEWIINNLHSKLFDKKIAVFCGYGNNGADGLVIARKMIENNFPVQIYIIPFLKLASTEFEENETLLKNIGANIQYITSNADLEKIGKADICIDAILGMGINRPATEIVLEVIKKINSFKSKVISVDIPSGLFAENNIQNNTDGIVKAYLTLTFEFPKLAFFFAENHPFVGQWEVLPIRLSPSFKRNEKSRYQVLEIADIKEILHPRKKFDHKGNFGHACILAGSNGKIGAAILAANACLRSGVGLLTVQVPNCGYTSLQTSLPEAMVIEDEGENSLQSFFHTSAKGYDQFDVIAIGPGIGKEESTANLLKQIIQNATAPLVMDADALNILSENKTWLSFLPFESILTPHPAEFDRLAGEKFSSGYERHLKQIELSVKYQIIIVLKGAHTSVTTPNGLCYFNTTGNPGMAKAGSGDVLTGMITAFLAQQYSAAHASFLGVYLHGLAGDFAREINTEHAMIATDIIKSIPKAFQFLEQF